MKRRRIIGVLTVLLIVYVSTYFVLSLCGCYEPTAWGLAQGKNGPVFAPKACFYQWAPKGFVHDLEWKTAMLIFFLPLWEIDRFTWHASDKCWSKQGYPVHEVKTE
jgi:hypothetical protein